MPSIQPTFFNLLDNEQLLQIEHLSDNILKNVGINLIDDPISIEMMRNIGAKVESQNVRIDTQTLRQLIKNSAPKTFKWRSTHHTITVGEQAPIFTPMFGAPNIRRKDNSYGLTSFKDYQSLVTLYENSEQIDSSGFLVCIAHDIDEKTRHLKMAQAHLSLSKKPMMGTVLSKQALKDVAQLAQATCLVPGECKLLHMINSTPPLTYQSNPLQCLRQASMLGQGSLISAYMMMGATSPVSIMGSLAQGLAEILVALALTQIYQPGVAVAGGLFATPFSMSKMLPAFGTPESHIAQIAGIQLIKRLGIPSRGDGFVTSAKVCDTQAKNEGIQAISASLYGGADLVLHTAGWLENGRCVDRTKLEQDLMILRSL